MFFNVGHLEILVNIHEYARGFRRLAITSFRSIGIASSTSKNHFQEIGAQDEGPLSGRRSAKVANRIGQIHRHLKNDGRFTARHRLG